MTSNPYQIADTPALTQTLGWVDAWMSKASVYAVAARNASDIAAAVRFARDNICGWSSRAAGTAIWEPQMHLTR